ncbi:MAG TPA: TonB family protein [Bacteroidia bacterium]|nr:TonB family protein [Bacteroidia bacterium]
MDEKYVLSASFNELVFENRNKKYGAYYIRRNYRRSVMAACVIASSAFCSAMGLYFLTQDNADAMTPPTEYVTHVVDLTQTTDVVNPPKEKQEVQKRLDPPAPKAPKATADLTTPVVTTTQPVTPPPANNEAGGKPTGVEGGTGTGDPVKNPCLDCEQDSAPAKPEPPLVRWASNPPSFPGIDKFFADNTHYPQAAKDEDIEGTVWLTWVVTTTGQVKDVQVLKGANPILDREALRVAKLMPAWTPGDDNGTPVNFIYNKPIRFVLSK